MTKYPQTIFISYVHKENYQGFAQRLGFSLKLWFDTFWDRYMPDGEWLEFLKEQISDSDVFLVIMTPHYQDSEVCMIELEHAQSTNKRILPIKVMNYEDNNLLQRHSNEPHSGIQFADFTQNFTKGFKNLTQMITKEIELIPWEHLGSTSDEELHDSIVKGNVPGLISLEMSDWIVVNVIWKHFVRVLERSKDFDDYVVYHPKTPNDVLRAATYLLSQLTDFLSLSDNDEARYSYDYFQTEKLIELIKPLVENRVGLRDIEHLKCSAYFNQIMLSVNEYVENHHVHENDVKEFLKHQQSYIFDTFSELRSLLNYHSRRSRFLY